jgi:heptosyltransferase III
VAGRSEGQYSIEFPTTPNTSFQVVGIESMRFLIIRACAIGDFVLHLPALRALASAYPQATFTLVGYPATLTLARSFLPVDAIHSLESQPWSGLFTAPITVQGFDAAWVWMKDETVAENLRKSGIPDVIHAASFPSGSPNCHAAEHLLRSVGLQAPPFPDLWEPNGPLILHPGSGNRSKIWPHFAELAAALPESRILLGPADAPLDVPNQCLSGISLDAVVEELRHCRAFVGNDSGITHIAAYWGTPTVALFGPTDPSVWGPLGRRVRVVHRPALTDISVADVRKLL